MKSSNPIFLSALFGIAKGIMARPNRAAAEEDLSYAGFFGPVLEEIMYRALPAAAIGNGALNGLSALTFAGDHVRTEKHPSSGSAVARFADVFLGGLLYENAFKQFGLVGAVAAHAAHNLAIGVVHRGRVTGAAQRPARTLSGVKNRGPKPAGTKKKGVR